MYNYLNFFIKYEEISMFLYCIYYLIYLFLVKLKVFNFTYGLKFFSTTVPVKSHISRIIVLVLLTYNLMYAPFCLSYVCLYPIRIMSSSYFYWIVQILGTISFRFLVELQYSCVRFHGTHAVCFELTICDLYLPNAWLESWCWGWILKYKTIFYIFCKYATLSTRQLL